MIYVEDGDIPYTIILGPVTSSDPKYSVIDPDDVTITNADDDTAGIYVDPTAQLTNRRVRCLDDVHRHAGTVSRQDDVTIAVASSDTTEGTVSTDQLTFTPLDWMTPKTVTVTGEGDYVEDGDIPYTIVLGPVTSFRPQVLGDRSSRLDHHECRR